MTLSGKITRRIQRWPLERVFSRFDFLDLGPTDAVGMALKRMHDAGTIRRVKRGFYDRPRSHPLWGVQNPSGPELVSAMARRSGTRVQAHGATAANELRLTEQVPAQIIYETDGPAREIDLGGRRPIKLTKRPRRDAGVTSEVARFVFAGLRNIGKAHLTPERVAHLRRELKPADRRQLLRNLPYAPAWMHPHLRTIASGDKKSAP
jgi:hypothetical protein